MKFCINKNKNVDDKYNELYPYACNNNAKNKHLDGQRETYLKLPIRNTNQVSRRKLIPATVVLTQMKPNTSLTFLWTSTLVMKHKSMTPNKKKYGRLHLSTTCESAYSISRDHYESQQLTRSNSLVGSKLGRIHNSIYIDSENASGLVNYHVVPISICILLK